MKLLLFLLISNLVNLIYAALEVSNPMFWERSFTMNISKSTNSRNLLEYTSYMITSQNFQGLFTKRDYDAKPEDKPNRVVFNFGDSCFSSNLTLDKLQQMNYNSIQVESIKNAEKLALVKRGNCNWSEKLSTVNNLALLNNINITAIFIYDNNTATENVTATFVSGIGSMRKPNYPNPLPASRNILNMADNDITESGNPIYFIPNDYGQIFINRINSMYNASMPNLRYYWLVTPYFDDVTWTIGSDSFFATGKGYLAYIVALGAIFIIAFILIRWWRIRRQRAFNQAEFSDGIRLQTRVVQLDPLPVDIVNRLPISAYQEDMIKNSSCAVCLEDFVPNKTDIRILPCGHGFCVLCIDPWLTQKSTLCPICKWDCLPVEMRHQRDNMNNNAVPENVPISIFIPGPVMMPPRSTTTSIPSPNLPNHTNQDEAIQIPMPMPTPNIEKDPFVDSSSSVDQPSSSSSTAAGYTSIDMDANKEEKKPNSN